MDARIEGLPRGFPFRGCPGTNEIETKLMKWLVGREALMTLKFDHEIEIERLLNLLKRREAQLVHAYDWRYEKELELNELKHQLAETKTEVERLKLGDFTEEEFHNVCHNQSEDDEQRFIQGRSDYRKRLFGCKNGENGKCDKPQIQVLSRSLV